MIISSTKIANLALKELGAGEITSLSEESREGKLCNEFYEPAREFLLAEHPWNFATERAGFAQLSEAPAFGYTYAYQKPADCVRVLEPNEGNDEFEWREEQGKILTDEGTCNMIYIKRITDETLFNPKFVEAFYCKLAEMLAYPLTKSNATVERMRKKYKEEIYKAKVIDSQTTSTRKNTATSWTNARL